MLLRPKLMQDSLRFWILCYGFWIPILDSGFVKSGFRITIISGIADSLNWIPESRYLFPGDKMATDLHLFNGGVAIHASNG